MSPNPFLLFKLFHHIQRAGQQILLILAPGYAQMLFGKIQVRREGSVYEHFNACAAPVVST
jgi:hypothetical protein